MAIQAQFPSFGSQDWIENCCGGLNNFYFNVQQQQKHQLQQSQVQQQCNIQQQFQNQQFQKDQTLLLDNNIVPPFTFRANPIPTNNNSLPSISFSQSMNALDQKQRQEIDHYFRLQDERLRLLLEDQRKRQVALLCKSLEQKVLPFIKLRDEQIVQATKRKMELEDRLKRLEMDNMEWQRAAQEKEAMIVSLNNTIEQLKVNAADDAESCCDMDYNRVVDETEQNRGLVSDDYYCIGGEEGRAEQIMMLCKVCNSRNSCILFLPCRHLCSCKACDACLDSCPVCQTVKKASIEALMV
ncbi:hypothetical protein K2173_012451 [Erythroxylum novogranatense]|uniref:RING-type domain-containing protein n=1 Tax=Erythroxylum novogranatense TaxID=1862640 RepID=A0AAV8TJA9_9ROSI|nr:hypothetical protein K2173_012451 [Erythroxylum novogranatense]